MNVATARPLGRWLGILVMLASHAVPIQIASGQAAGPWPMFRHDAQRTGTTALVGPERPSIFWRYNLGGYSYSSASISTDGTLYVGSADSIYAVRPDGTPRWTRAVGIGDYAIASPTLANGTLFIGARDSLLYALDMASGQTRWGPRAFPHQVWASPLFADGRLYLGAFDFRLYALSPADGQDVWASPVGTGGEIISSAAQAPNGTVYVGSLDDRLYAIAPGGAARWAYQADSSIVSTPAVAFDGTVVFGALDGTIHALNPDGSERWRFRTGDEIVSSAAVTPDGRVYMGSTDGFLYAFSLSGTEQWRFQTDGDLISSPAVDGNGTVYVGSLRGTLYAIHPDGTEKWRMALGSPIWSSPTVGPDQRVYVASTGTADTPGLLYAIGNAPFEAEPDDEPEVDQEESITIVDPPFVPDQATLFYRRGGDTEYQSVEVPVEGGGPTYTASIPASFVTLRGVEYYVRLQRGAQVETFPPVNPTANPVILTVRASSAVSTTAVRAQRHTLVSVPVDAEDPRASALFNDDYAGLGGLTGWRLVEWDDFRRRYIDVGPDDSLRLGRSYFLITRNGGAFNTGAATSTSTEAPYSITLRPGWNQIATPFAFPVAWSDVQYDQVAVGDLAVFDGQTFIQGPGLADTLRLRPWQGILVNNRTDRPQSLSIPPRAAPEAAAVASKDASSGYMLHLDARLAGTELRDRYNGVGFSTEDQVHRIQEAPPVGPGVNLTVRDEGTAFAYHSRRLTAEGAAWTLDLEVREHQGREVTLHLHPEGALSGGFAVYVIDADREEVLPVEDGRVRIYLDEATDAKRLRVVIGTEAYLRRQYGEASDAPRAFALRQNYPNPFNPETIIRYEVSEQRRVRLDVFDVLGRRVATLADGLQTAGRYEVVWDGTDAAGRPVASGVYVYRLTAGGASFTRSMTLLR